MLTDFTKKLSKPMQLNVSCDKWLEYNVYKDFCK
nr:MAG TPA: hypothetical protein [Caudoviricetes sp.]